MKKYQSINRINKSREAYSLNTSIEITIEEKLDGANAGFHIENNELILQSRNNILNPYNTLSGYYGYMTDFLKDKQTLINPNYIYFGSQNCHFIQ